MAFYHGGVRFAGRRLSDPQSSTQPPNPSTTLPATYDSNFHPLRQNGVNPADTMPSPHYSDYPTNPMSFAVRSNPRPAPPNHSSLYHDPPPRPPQLIHSDLSASSAHYTELPRKPSVPDRSPLQKLEVTLGDVSKEEKRARIEEAEDIIRRNSSAAARRFHAHPSSAATPHHITRKPLPTHAVSDAPAHTFSQSSTHPRPTPASRTYNLPDSGLLPPSSNPTPSRDRRQGYDALLTGGAAAAALGAYQTSRGYNRDANLAKTAPPSSFEQQSQPSTGSFQQIPDQQPTSTPVRGGNLSRELAQIDSDFDRDDLSTRNYPHKQGSKASRILGTGGAEATDQVPAPRGSVRFSGTVNVDRPPDRRYKAPKFLDDWKTAAVAQLTAQDLDLESAASTHHPWWEKDPTRKQRGQQSTVLSGVSHDDLQDSVSKTTFQPPLTLKCGPLLRYTGIRCDEAGPGGATGKTFWRGSVMIVSEDARSSTDAPPTLRLFKQPMDSPRDARRPSAPEPNLQRDNILSSDSIAGHTKCSPQGETAFVKPLNQVPEGDVSLVDGDEGLFEGKPSTTDYHQMQSRLHQPDGEKLGRSREVKGHRLHKERGVTFWKFSLEIELAMEEMRVAYKINKGPPIGFWVPAVNQTMHIMFHSCNGFSQNVDSSVFSGPDPMWRDVLNQHQQKPFHVMIGGGNQIYNDVATKAVPSLSEWLATKDPATKHSADLSEDMQHELEHSYLDRYAMWFSQGLFGLANSQIPMINIWEDHDIFDGFGTYPDRLMSSPVLSGIGNIAFKYYLLFQHQSVPDETQENEPSWVLGRQIGPYIRERSRSLFVSLGHQVDFIGIDCRTERTPSEILTQETYDAIFDRLRAEIAKSHARHLIVLLGVPIAYPRLNAVENILTSRVTDQIKALSRRGVMSGLVSRFDSGFEILDDLNDHWTAKRHKDERNWFVEELQELASDESVRITILSGDVHVAAVGQFFSSRKLGIPKDQDHRYMPNVVSSAIVNAPPSDTMIDMLNKRHKLHHLNPDTDEGMIPLFTYDVDTTDRKNSCLLARRNWCSIQEFSGEITPPPSPNTLKEEPPKRRRSFSLTRRNSAEKSDIGKSSLLRRFSRRAAPPSSFRSRADVEGVEHPYTDSNLDPRVEGPLTPRSRSNEESIGLSPNEKVTGSENKPTFQRSDSFHRRPNNVVGKTWSKDKSGREGHINLEGGLDISIHCEIDQSDPSGATMPYRLIVPALFYLDEPDLYASEAKERMPGFLGRVGRRLSLRQQAAPAGHQLETSPDPVGAPHDSPEQESNRAISDGGASLYDAQSSRPGQVDSPVSNEALGYDSFPSRDTQSRSFQTAFEHLPRASAVETEAPYGQISREQMLRRSGSLTDRSKSSRDQMRLAPIHTLHHNMHGQQPAPLSWSKRHFEHNEAQLHSHNDPQSPPLPSVGLDAPLGKVGNRISSQPTNVPWNSADAPWSSRAQSTASNTRGEPRSFSDSAAINSAQNRHHDQLHSEDAPGDVMAALGTTNKRSSVTKDPYAHYYPEAVEAEWNSEEGVDSEEENHEMHLGHAGGAEGSRDVDEASSLGSAEAAVPSQRREYDRYYAQKAAAASPNSAEGAESFGTPSPPPMPRKSSQRHSTSSGQNQTRRPASSKLERHFGGYDGVPSTAVNGRGEGGEHDVPGTIGMPSVSTAAASAAATNSRSVGQAAVSEKAARKLGVESGPMGGVGRTTGRATSGSPAGGANQTVMGMGKYGNVNFRRGYDNAFDNDVYAEAGQAPSRPFTQNAMGGGSRLGGLLRRMSGGAGDTPGSASGGNAGIGVRASEGSNRLFKTRHNSLR